MMNEYETYISTLTEKELFYTAFNRFMMDGWNEDGIASDVCASDVSILLSETTYRPDEEDMTPEMKRFLLECE